MDRPNVKSHCHKCLGFSRTPFCTLQGGELDSLDRSKSVRHFAEGRPIFSEGEPAKGIFCLRSGRVKLQKSTSRGRQHLLRFANPGELLGLSEVMAEVPHPATADPVEEVAACFIPRADLLELFARSPEVARAIAHELAKLGLQSDEERAEIASADVRERVAHVLLRLGRSHGTPHRQGKLIRLPMTREDLAQMAGTAVETTIRQISAFRDEGILAAEGRAVVIVDESKLARVAREKI